MKVGPSRDYVINSVVAGLIGVGIVIGIFHQHDDLGKAGWGVLVAIGGLVLAARLPWIGIYLEADEVRIVTPLKTRRVSAVDIIDVYPRQQAWRYHQLALDVNYGQTLNFPPSCCHGGPDASMFSKCDEINRWLETQRD